MFYVFELVMGRFLIVSISLQIPNSPWAVNKAVKFNPERAFEQFANILLGSVFKANS